MISSSRSLVSVPNRAFTAGGLRQHIGGLGYQAQGQQHQAQPDQHPANTAQRGGRARNEQHHANEDEEGRQPRQVAREGHGHQAGANVRTQHDGQRRRQVHQALADKGRHDQRRGCAGLHHRRDAYAGDHRRKPVADTVRQDVAQIGAEHPQDAGADQVRPPDQKRNGRKEVQQVGQAGPFNAKRMRLVAAPYPGQLVKNQADDAQADGRIGHIEGREVSAGE